ncbi:unnamed protein product [Durusdinium trenchii]|uniref:PROP1-like PPR domain-containing protein n=1 Tax=Durusdinium trenchii TaxID=1381693 RepID=A0ABP0SCX2_9DINO
MSSAEQLLRALLHAQLHGRAVELLHALCQPGASAPSDHVFNLMLDAAVRARSYGEAWDVLELLLKSGRKADKYFVSILTKSLESSNDKRWVRRGINLVDKFIEQQQEDVDEIVFNSLLNVLGQTGDMLKLQQTLNKMNDYGVSPSAVTFGTVVKAYGRARDTESVIKVWNQMRSRCLGINPVTCGCVLDACVKCNSLDKAMAIFQEMRMQGMHKNTVLYATLIKGLAKIRDLQGAMNLYHEMRMEGVPCNLVTFNSLMDVCVRCGDLQTAAYFLQDMMQMGIEPDLITFSTLIKGYSHIGEVHKALALSKELKARGLKCDEIMYNSLIDGCAKARKLHEGLSVFEEMLQSRVQPSNITFSILVKLHFEVESLMPEPEKLRFDTELEDIHLQLQHLNQRLSRKNADPAVRRTATTVLDELSRYFGEDHSRGARMVLASHLARFVSDFVEKENAAEALNWWTEFLLNIEDARPFTRSNWAHASAFEEVLSRCRIKLLDLKLEDTRPPLRLREALREVHNAARHAADDLLEVLYIGLRAKPAADRFSYMDLCQCMQAGLYGSNAFCNMEDQIIFYILDLEKSYTVDLLAGCFLSKCSEEESILLNCLFFELYQATRHFRKHVKLAPLQRIPQQTDAPRLLKILAVSRPYHWPDIIFKSCFRNCRRLFGDGKLL